MTLLLVVALLCGVGLATAGVAIQITDASVDRSLRDAATAAIAYLELVDVDATPTPSPSPSPSTSPTEEVGPSGGNEPTDGSEPSEDTEPEDGVSVTASPRVSNQPRLSQPPDNPDGESGEPQATDQAPATDEPNQPEPSDDSASIATNPPLALLGGLAGLPGTPAATTDPEAELEPEDQPPAASDTFFLVLDAQGQLLSNPRRVLLAGLPNTAAASAAMASGEDWRTVYADGAPVRLFTKRVSDGHGGPPALLQSGMVLTLQDVQRNQILMTIVLASLLGLLGAGLVSLLVTRRALAPIRSAFNAERRFVAAASHELRTPVALLHALAEVLQREDLIKPEGRQLVDDIIGETDRLGRLVGDLLALSSAEAGAVVINPQPLEARAFVADLARRVEGMAAGRGISVNVEQAQVDVSPALPLLTDVDRLAQLLLIFVDNAIDHSPANGVVKLIVGPTGEHDQARVAIAVTDQGPGVPPAERERIFEPFHRLRGRGRNGDSTGLGLAIARNLATSLGATLRVDDAAGGGALFSVSLPRAEAKPGDRPLATS
jgi:signal transduction histidine kinase